MKKAAAKIIQENRQDWYRHFNFLKGATLLTQLPEDHGREIAFVGRSNVGKSSVINALTGRRALANISKMPGRTRDINYFVHDSGQRLVDLPGYGFAKVSKQMRQHWGQLLSDYLAVRKSLCGILLIMDIRHPLSALDQQMIAFSHTHHTPVYILLNKADKLAQGARTKQLQQLTQQKQLEGVVHTQLFSASKKQGINEGRSVLFRCLFQ